MKSIQFLSLILLMALFALSACESDDDPVEPAADTSGLVINEFMAENDTLDVDGLGGTPDWIEIYNPGVEGVDLRGWFMTDDISEAVSSWYHIPLGPSELLVPAGGWLVLFANSHPEMGPRYLDFKLSDTGESIGLANVSGTIVDNLVFEQQTANLSMGCFPDGIGNVIFLTTPTPGAPNTGAYGNLTPVLRSVILDEEIPLPETDVTVTAEIFDDDGILAAILYYNVDGGDWIEVPMNAVSKVINSYSCVIPGQAHDAVVGYYILVTDSALVDMVWPEGAPNLFETFSPSFQLPYTLFINEFMALNTSFDVDGTGDFPDWIELYNPGETAIDIGGMFVTDDLDSPEKWQIPTSDPIATTIDAGGFLVLFADLHPELGVLHLNFKLSSEGEDVALFAEDEAGYILMADGYTFETVTVDVSEGRQSDGAEGWTTFVVPTPGFSNSMK